MAPKGRCTGLSPLLPHCVISCRAADSPDIKIGGKVHGPHTVTVAPGGESGADSILGLANNAEDPGAREGRKPHRPLLADCFPVACRATYEACDTRNCHDPIADRVSPAVIPPCGNAIPRMQAMAGAIAHDETLRVSG